MQLHWFTPRIPWSSGFYYFLNDLLTIGDMLDMFRNMGIQDHVSSRPTWFILQVSLKIYLKGTQAAVLRCSLPVKRHCLASTLSWPFLRWESQWLCDLILIWILQLIWLRSGHLQSDNCKFPYFLWLDFGFFTWKRWCLQVSTAGSFFKEQVSWTLRNENCSWLIIISGLTKRYGHQVYP